MTLDVRIVKADRLDCRIVTHEWDFDLRRGGEIDAYWRERTQANPSLYDGPVLLGASVEQAVGGEGRSVLSIGFFETRFSRFLAWRNFGFPGPGVYNCFAMPAVRSADGAFLLGEMNPRHSSAGNIYFPAGTPDPIDVRDGRVDLEGSLRRELEEETGICAEEGLMEPGWTIVFESRRVACMKLIQSPHSAAVLLSRVETFLAREKEPELSGAHMISRRDQLADPRLPGFMKGFLASMLT